MSEEQSLINRGERFFDDLLRLWRRRRLLCVGILVVLLSPSAILVADKFWGRSQLEAKVASLNSELSDAKRERDSKAAQLAPFLAVANQRFESAPPDKRLELLVDRLETVTQTLREAAANIPSRSTSRTLSEEAISRIQKKLDFAAPIPITVDAPLGDAEAIRFAQQIKSVFERSGFNVNGVNQAVWTQPPEGVFLRCKRVPEGILSEALLQLFSELGVKPSVAIDESMAEPDLAIVVGSKSL